MSLIAADRDHKPLVCPSCGSAEIERVPRRDPRTDAPDTGRITLHCKACGRSAVYLARGGDTTGFSPEEPYRH